MNEQERIAQLRRELHRHNHLYYVLNKPELSDRAFDALMHELQELESRHPEMADPNSPTVRVGSDLSQDFQAVSHERPMLSLGNTYSRQDVADWCRRVAEGLDGEPFELCCELKFDGLSISLLYEDGQLQRAVTRGDGVRGDDVTLGVRTIRSIPLVLPPEVGAPRRFEMRGEVLMPWSSFEALNRQRQERGEPLFANPRNAAAGTLKSKSTAVVAERGLDAYLYYLLGDELPAASHWDNLQAARSWGFKVSDAMRLAHSQEEVFDFIDHWDAARAALPVATDGIVLKVNNLSQQQRLGTTAKSPRWAIAYKFQPDQARTRLVGVTFQVGRTGAVTPVAEMQPVQLAGTIVKRASLHNEDVMRGLDLHIGDYVFVEKAGEIIPQVVGVDKAARAADLGRAVDFAKNCPACGAQLVRYEGEAAHYCPNDAACPPQLKGRIEHFISREAMNIESLGPETVDEWFDRGLVHDVADLYTLSVEDLCGASRARERSARKVVDGIRRSLDVPLERVIFALGIRFVGRVAAASLATHFGSMERLATATMEQLTEVEGVGGVIAQSVVQYFADERNRSLVSRLAEAGVQMTRRQVQQLSDALEGKKVMISGTFSHHSRDEYKALIAAHGGRCVSSITSQTDFVLAGEGMGPSKKAKAEQLGVKLMAEDDFLRLIGEQA